MSLVFAILCKLALVFSADMHENERWDKDGENCPGIDHCWTCCPLGRIRDDQGCLKCDCIKKGNFSDILISGCFFYCFFFIFL